MAKKKIKVPESNTEETGYIDVITFYNKLLREKVITQKSILDWLIFDGDMMNKDLFYNKLGRLLRDNKKYKLSEKERELNKNNGDDNGKDN